MKKNILTTLVMLSGAFASTASNAACLGNVYSMNAGRGHVGALIDIKENASIPGSTYWQDAADRAVIHSKALFSSSAMAYDKNTDRIYYANVPAPVTYYMDNAETFFTEEELKSLDFHAQRTTPPTLAYFDVATQEHVEVATTKFPIFRMAFHPETGELYASDNRRFFKVNAATGDVTEIAEWPFNARVGGFTTWGDFEFYNNELLYVTSGRTYVVDLATADLTLKAFHFVDFVTSVTTDQNGQLIMAAKNQNVTGNVNSNHLWRFKPETGERVQVGLFPTRISALATVTSEEHTCYEKTIFPSDEVTKVDVTSVLVPVEATVEGKSGTVTINLSEATTDSESKLLIRTNLESASYSDFSQNITVSFSNGAPSISSALPTNGEDLSIALPAGVTSVSFDIAVNADTENEGQEEFIVSAEVAESNGGAKSANFAIIDDDSANNIKSYVTSIAPPSTPTKEGTFGTITISLNEATRNADNQLFILPAPGNLGISYDDIELNTQFRFSNGQTANATIPQIGGLTLSLPEGVSSLSFDIYAKPDTVIEGVESMLLFASILDSSQGSKSTIFSVTDGDGSPNPTPNAKPVAYNGFASTPNNATLNGSVPAATDSDGTVVSYQLVQSVSAGSLSFNTNGSYTFVPGNSFADLTSGQSRNVSFRYTARDNDGAVSDAKTMTITVTGTAVVEPNVRPVAYDGSVSTNNTTTLNASVPSATDTDGTIASYQLVQNVSAGSLSFNSNGSYSFTPGSSFSDLISGQSRNVTFRYTATDNDGAVSDARTMTITVTGTDSGTGGFALDRWTGYVDVWEGGAPSGQHNGPLAIQAGILFTEPTTANSTPLHVEVISGSATVGDPLLGHVDLRNSANAHIYPMRTQIVIPLTPQGTTVNLPKGATSFGIMINPSIDYVTEGPESFTIGVWTKTDRSDYTTRVITIHDHDSPYKYDYSKVVD